MNFTIYSLRHGETTASQTGGYCGTLDPDLTLEGYQMAEDFADAYRSLPWVAAFWSPLRRGVATAKPLCHAAGIRMQLKEGLREIATHGPLLHLMGDWAYLREHLRRREGT
jgi:broad specificity phosphatase PhoE